jgi:hypothetical protein
MIPCASCDRSSGWSRATNSAGSIGDDGITAKL